MRNLELHSVRNGIIPLTSTERVVSAALSIATWKVLTLDVNLGIVRLVHVLR